MKTGELNSIADIAGLKTGCAHCEKRKTGVTAILFEEPAVASVAVLGGGPATRETDLLLPEKTVQKVDALVLSGGSAFGLQAGAGVMDALVNKGRGLQVGSVRVPIVPTACIFDLMNGGALDDKTLSLHYELGQAAFTSAHSEPPSLGSVGAGLGATTATLKGGQGSASALLSNGATIAALMIVNAFGSPIFGDGPHFWAAPFEAQAEFGGLGMPTSASATIYPPPFKHDPRSHLGVHQDPGIERQNTTIGVVVTDMTLTKAQCAHLATAAHDGLARALWPVHTPFDGDLIFAASTEQRQPIDPNYDFAEACAMASAVVARAIARGVYEAEPQTQDVKTTWRERFGA